MPIYDVLNTDIDTINGMINQIITISNEIDYMFNPSRNVQTSYVALTMSNQRWYDEEIGVLKDDLDELIIRLSSLKEIMDKASKELEIGDRL